jgi:PBP1b-binding outer membrane lipoprotein LpoB
MLKKLNVFFLVVPMALFLAGCAPKLDTSSKESMEKSVAAMTADMTAEQKVALQQAMMKISLSAIGSASGNFLLGAAKAEESMKKLDGMTADEIIETAKKIK